MDRITREDLRKLLDAGAVRLIEAMPREAFEAEHIPGAVNLPDRLDSGLAEQLAPDKAGTVVVYCSGSYCNRSRIAAAAFVRMGYTDVRVYAGGKQDWLQAGLPFVGTRTGVMA